MTDAGVVVWYNPSCSKCRGAGELLAAYGVPEQRVLYLDNPPSETEIARVLDNLLTRAEHGPDTAGRKIAARTRAALASHWAPTPEPAAPEPAKPAAASRPDTTEAIPFGVFDADAEAERWI